MRSSPVRRVALAGWLLLLPGAWAATVVHSPYLQNMHQDRVTIVWSTRENLSAVVQYSTDQSFSQSGPAPVIGVFPPAITGLSYQFYQYRVELTGLAQNTSYHYRVLAGGQDITTDGERQFTTAPASQPFRFLAFGDSGLGSSAQLALALRMAGEQANLVLHVGDIAYESGTYDEFTANYFSYYYTIMRRVPFFPVPGNHEYYTNLAAPYLGLNIVPTDNVPGADQGRYYSFDWGAAHFVAVDANLLDPAVPAFASARARMLAWLDEDLSTTQAPWKIVYWHQIPYPVFHHADDPVCLAARQQLVPIVEKYGVQLVLTGHEHEYLRTKVLHANNPVASGSGTVYVSTGGGGGGLHPLCAADNPPDVPPDTVCPLPPLVAYQTSSYHYLAVDVSASQIAVHAIGMDGKEFDHVNLVLPGVTTAGIVNGASFSGALAPGGLVSIFGQGLASGTAAATAYPLPAALSGTSVTLNGKTLPLFYVSPGQINAQLPMDVTGTATLHVATASGGADAAIAVSDTAPAVFPSGVLHADYVPVSASSPAVAGETLLVFATGLGLVNGPLASGQPAPATPLLSVVNPVVVDFGSATVTPIFAGLSPGLASVYQVNVVVPNDLATNVYPLQVAAKGNLSNVTNVQVRARTP